MGFSVIAAHMGYAESSFASVIIFRAREPFATAYEALHSLARSFLGKYFYTYGENFLHNVCCKNQGEGPFCSQCGRSLRRNAFELRLFSAFIQGHLTNDMDSYGEPLGSFGVWEDSGFLRDLVSVPREQILELTAYAEDMIVRALEGSELSDPESDDHGFDQILRKGVKSYWEGNHGEWDYEHGKPPKSQEEFKVLFNEYWEKR